MLFLTNCESNSSNDNISNVHRKSAQEIARPLTEEELKQQLMQKECAKFNDYLEGSMKYIPIFRNALSLKVNGLKITCKIKNSATLATFKDIKAHVDFMSKTGTKIFEKEFDIYEFILPNNTIEYKTEIEITNQQYNDISQFNWSIVDASCQ